MSLTGDVQYYVLLTFNYLREKGQVSKHTRGFYLWDDGQVLI